MTRVAQIGIALGVLGVVLALMGLFPGVTGIDPTVGIGIVQIFIVLAGFSLILFGALIYVKFNFYPHQAETLAQQVGVRLALTGLIITALSGLSDILGFGSHPRDVAAGRDVFLGTLQAIGMVGGYFIAALGVLLFALAGRFDDDDDHDPSGT